MQQRKKLTRKIHQSLLPVLTRETGMMHGVVCIPNQVFSEERLVEVAPNKFVPATVVTRSVKWDENTGQEIRRDFVAVQYSEEESKTKPWLTLPMFLSTNELGAVGEWYQWIYKTGLTYDIGIGVKNIASGSWSNTPLKRNTAWDTTNENDPNSPYVNPNNRPNIGNGTDEGWDKRKETVKSSKLNSPHNTNTKLRWDFNIKKLAKGEHFDCEWQKVFKESLDYYGYEQDVPTSIELIQKDERFKVGFMYQENINTTNNSVPSLIRFLCTEDVQKGQEFVFCFEISCIIKGKYDIEVHCNCPN